MTNKQIEAALYQIKGRVLQIKEDRTLDGVSARAIASTINADINNLINGISMGGVQQA